jgi:hypothetical protein
MAPDQRFSPRRRTHRIQSLSRLLLFAPVAGYWLVAAIAVTVRPNPFELFLMWGLPLVVLAMVVCARARRLHSSD